MIRRTLISAAAVVAVAYPAQSQSFPSADAAAAAHGFGAAVAVGNDEIFVAEPTNRFRPGIVYVYARSAEGGWVEKAQLTARNSARRDRFGRAIAVDGNTLLVSSQSTDSAAKGVVHIFGRGADGSWTETDSFLSGSLKNEQYGASLAVSGDVAFIGAPMAGDSTGMIYMVRKRGDIWPVMSHEVLTAPNLQPGDRLGSAMVLSDGHLFAGMPSRDDNKGGIAHFQRGSTGKWSLAPAPTSGAPEAGDRFGASVAMHGDRVWVGAPGRGGGLVATFSYDSVGSRWREGAPLQRFDGVRGTAFGSFLAVSEDGLWVGVPGNNRITSRVHLYRFDGDGWDGMDVLSLPNQVTQAPGRATGTVLAVKDGVAVVGLPSSAIGAGNAMVFERSGDSWQGISPLESAPESMAAVTGDQVRCEDGVAANFSCDAVDLISFLPVSEIGGVRGMRLNDLWGWTDSTTDREYVIIGRSDGASFVDLTDAAHPRYLGDLPMTPGARVAVWRDMKVYRDHVYIVADGAGQHGVQVFNLDRLRRITTPETFEPDYLYTNIASAHNIVINEETGFGYVVGASSGGETCGGGLHMIDLHEPGLPKFVGCHSDGETGRRGTGYSHDAQCLVYRGPDEDYNGHEICVGSNETALSLADVTDKANPVQISTVTYPKVAYTHQGWFSDDHKWFFSNDEIDEANGSIDFTRTLVWDMADLDDPVLLTEYFATTSATDHNLYVRGNYMYQSNTGDGLRIIDISNPADPQEVGYFDTDTDGSGGGTWSNYPYFESGVIAVTGGFAGIFFLKKREQIVP